MKYTVWALITGTVKIGEYEADSKEQAVEMAEKDSDANWNPTLCWQCSNEVELGDDAHDPFAEKAA